MSEITKKRLERLRSRDFVGWDDLPDDYGPWEANDEAHYLVLRQVYGGEGCSTGVRVNINRWLGQLRKVASGQLKAELAYELCARKKDTEAAEFWEKVGGENDAIARHSAYDLGGMLMVRVLKGEQE